MTRIARSGHALMPILLVLLLAAALSAGCYTQGETTCGQESNPTVTLRGRVVDARTDQPLEGSIVAVELCGIYSENVDPSKGHPNYRHGALTARDGSFEVQVPKGKAGLHTFMNGYRYGFVEASDVAVGEQLVRAEPLLSDDKKPVVQDVRAEPGVVSPGSKLSIAATVTASSVRDPLSEEVILYEPRTGLLRAMTPPSRGIRGKSFPNGSWRQELTAPSAPGDYVYSVVVSSEQCVTSDRASVKVTVR